MRKKHVFTLGILILIILIFTGCNFSSYTDVRYFRENYQPGLSLELRNSVGNIEIKNWSEKYVYIEATIRGQASDPMGAERIVRLTQIDVQKRGKRIQIRGIYPDSSYSNSVRIEYSIRIPERFNGEIITSTGDIEIERMKGNLSVRTNTGGCRIGSIEGNLTARMGTDDLIISYLKGKIDAEMSTGKVRANLELPVGSFSSIRTSTGDIDVNLGRNSTSRLTAATSTGDIYLNGILFEEKIITNLGFGGELNLKSSTGNIMVRY